MKSIFLYGITLFLFSHVSIAQYQGLFSSDVFQSGQKYEGWIKLNNGKVLNGYLEAKDANAHQKAVWFYENKDDKKYTTKYKVDDIQEYQMGHLYYKRMPYSGGIGKQNRLILVIEKGAVNICYWYELDATKLVRVVPEDETPEEAFNIVYPSRQIYFKEGKKPLEHQMLALGFSKKMSTFLADDSEIASKIKNKENGYKLLNVYKIIEEYNKKH